MRAAVLLALVLLGPGVVTVAADHSPYHPILHRQGTGPGWTLDTFTAPRELIEFSVGLGHHGEFAAQLVHLYNGKGVLIAGLLYTHEAGRDPDVAVTVGDLTVQQDVLGSNASRYPVVKASLRCSSACSMDRNFQVLVVTAGDVDIWGYAVFSPAAVAGTATRNGTTVGALPTTSFQGIAAEATYRYDGVVATVASTHSLTAVDGFVGAFGKPSILRAAASSAQTPTASKQCFCVFRDDPPGDYSFSYTDVDALATPGVLVWADVDL